MKYSLKTRVFAMLLAIVMVVGVMPIAAFATEETGTDTVQGASLTEGTGTEGTGTEGTGTEGTGTEGTGTEGTGTEGTGTEGTGTEGTGTEGTGTEGTGTEGTGTEGTGTEGTGTEGTGNEDTDTEGTDTEGTDTEDTDTEEEGTEEEEIDAQSETAEGSLTVASSTVSKLAPGVTETSVVAYDANGDRIQYFVVNANIATDSTVLVKANYHDNDNTGSWGKATVVEQANAAKEKRGYNVVASTNASYYNVSTGQPTGGFVMEGVNINGDAMGNQYEFFAIMKDGTAMIGKRGTFSQYSANIQEAVAGHLLLVWDGAVVEGLNNSSKYPRSTVGIKANGDVVLMLADGNNKPYSAGLTYVEQAQLMLELGCVTAIELDGGGSATYAAKLEGSDEIEVRNVCCDGTVRSVSNTLMVISTAVADGTFDHANLSTEYAYYAPNSVVEIEAVGVDAAGNAADLPEEATWVLSDATFGTIADGVFTSTGKTGTVTAKMVSGDNVVGSVDITVVNPTSIAFSADEKTVPYGKTSDFTITAMYNGAEMYAAADAYEFTASAGSMDGFIYTAPTDDSTSATVTATYKYAELAAITVSVTFGQGSEVLVDFEDGDISDWVEYYGLVEAAKNGTYTGGYSATYGASSGVSNYIQDGIKENVFLASRENGDPVYSGDYALGYTVDYTQSTAHANWQYSYLYYLGDLMKYRDVENGINGTRLGMWMYIPEEAVGLCARLAYTYETSAGALNTAYLYFTYQYVSKGFSKLTSEKIPEAGWAYVYCDLDDISTTYVTSSYYKDEDGNLTRAAATNYAPAFIQFIVSSSATGAEKCTVYIDDITLDYSDVVDDRDAPVISNPLALDDLNSYSMGRTLNFSTVSFTADVAEDTSHGTNFTGLNASTAQIYVDGQKVATSYAAGKIATANLNLPNGTHDVTFEIADNQGNYTKLTKQIVIAAETEYPVITVTGAAPAVNSDGNLYTGAQYNILVKTDKVEAIDKVTTKIWLNSASKWSLANMSTLPGFKVTYSLDELACTATITVTREGDVAVTGEATLVTIPVYAWSWTGSAGVNATTQWNTNGCAPQIDVSYDVKYGKVTYTDGYAVSAGNYVSGFGGARVDVETELNSSIANLKNSIGEWHYHSSTAVEDVEPTCTTGGHTGRTVCSVCKSTLTWGTTSATGHTYTLTDGVLKCHCGDLFSGTWTDGKDYVDGVAVSDGWNGDSYYIDGVKLTGIQEVEGLYYDFGEDGISKGKYTGIFTKDEDVYNAIVGVLQTGWGYDTENENYYYFSTEDYKAVDGMQTIGGHSYEFENKILVDGEWVKDSKGLKFYWAGQPHATGWATIKDKTYHFTNGYAAVGVFWVETSRYSGDMRYYLFDENGVLVRMLDGIHEGIYYHDGQKTPYLGLVELDGAFYYVNDGAKVITSKTYYITKTNDLTFENGTAVAKGSYEFDADGKMIVKQGLVDGVYYEYGIKVPYKGLIKQDGNFYYINDGAKPVTGKTYYITRLNDLTFANGTAVAQGAYEFDADGKMLVKEGLIDGIYYENGIKVPYKGLIKQDGSFYYINDGAKPVAGRTYYITRLNGLTFDNGTAVTKGNYIFDDEGKMHVMEGLIDGYYYENGVKVPYKGLIEQDGNFYYINDGAKPVAGRSYYITRLNDLTYADGTPITKGTYTFDADGKMVIN